MLTWSEIVPLLLAAALITISPGPAFALIIRTSARSGWRAAMPVLAGVELGILAWALLSAVGVAGVVAASPTAFTVLKVVGAVVLVALGVQAWRSSFRVGRSADDAATSVDKAGGWARFGTGLATNLANPKTMVFCLAFFQQFIPAHAAVVPATAILVSLMVAVDTVWFTAMAMAAARARGFFARAGVRKGLDRTAGTVFIGLAARMATLAR